MRSVLEVREVSLPAVPSACFISEIIQWNAMKFGKKDLH
jgi:hypothetical protein